MRRSGERLSKARNSSSDISAPASTPFFHIAQSGPDHGLRIGWLLTSAVLKAQDGQAVITG
ncbi:hypothetical protein [Actinoplanes campanulatus]|uniref:hypothetical protein n=1 Tax=Actinoplanes campanulatus TaxID=113559 RepID=UPI001953C099|nr:hypothetical protein [Actinoplanes capillaceus]